MLACSRLVRFPPPSAHREWIIEIGPSPLYLFDLWKTPPIQYYSRQLQAGARTPQHNQAIRQGTMRNANILSPLDVKRKEDQPGCRWRRGLLVVGGRASMVVARTTVSLELFRSNFSPSNSSSSNPSALQPAVLRSHGRGLARLE